MTAKLCQENTTESVRSGFLDLGVNQVWQVITANRIVDADVVLSDPDLPAIGSGQLFSGNVLYAINRAANRVDTDATGRKWHVTVQWSNNTSNFARNATGVPVQDPTLAAKDVVITYQEYEEPITDAKIYSITKSGPHGVGSVAGMPDWFDLTANTPVMVSTGEPVEATRTQYQEIINVSRTERDWDATYKDYTNTINDAEVVITESDSEGVKATYTYPKWTLRMKPITKQKVWYSSVLYYRVTFEMEYNEATWVFAQHDVSQKRRVFAGPPAQRYLDNTTYTQADVDKIAGTNAVGTNYYIQSIMTFDKDGNPEAAIGDPVSLNGYGAEMPTPRADSVPYDDDKDQFYLNFMVYLEKDWSVLSL